MLNPKENITIDKKPREFVYENGIVKLGYSSSL